MTGPTMTDAIVYAVTLRPLRLAREATPQATSAQTTSTMMTVTNLMAVEYPWSSGTKPSDEDSR